MRLYLFLGDRLLHLATACVIACFASNVVAAETNPYEARVVAARAQVRSGPGENFYPTDALAQGETVEVYREEAGGWLAIRPPRESFSWVFGRHLKLGEDGLAVVDKDDIGSRIGSRFSGQRNAVQVRLRKGEVVEIIGEEADGREKWYKIAPPAGEFRWIHATNVQAIGPLSPPTSHAPDEPIIVVAATTEDSSASGAQAAETEADPAEANAAETVVPAPESQPAPDNDWRPAPAGSAPPPLQVAAPPLAASTAPAAAVGADERTLPTAPPIPSAARAATTQLPDALARKLTDVELRLSRMVAEPPDRWNTERLERDVEQLLARAESATERETLKSTLAKIDRFAAIGRRYQEKNGRVGDGEWGRIEGNDVSPSPPLPVSPSGFDAVGILRPVVSKRPGAPQFALVDDRGQVTSFVTPTPDVNLQPYVGRRVGITGNRGFIAEFQRAHVTAGRVTPLSELVRR